MDDQPTLLIVDDEKPTREGLRAALEGCCNGCGAEAAAIILLKKD